MYDRSYVVRRRHRLRLAQSYRLPGLGNARIWIDSFQMRTMKPGIFPDRWPRIAGGLAGIRRPYTLAPAIVPESTGGSAPSTAPDWVPPTRQAEEASDASRTAPGARRRACAHPDRRCVRPREDALLTIPDHDKAARHVGDRHCSGVFGDESGHTSAPAFFPAFTAAMMEYATSA